MLKGKVVVVGICGGIAAYKIAEVVSRLKKLQAEVRVIMTKAATEFISPMTLATLAKHPVAIDMFGQSGEPHINHIELGQQGDVILIAPATANMVGKIANGIADDLLSTTIMAATVPVLLAPSMNLHMYENPIFQQNLQRLSGAGFHILSPGEGFLACGDSGRGRLPEPEQLVQAVVDLFGKSQDLADRRILITAGGTREALDPVRFLSNRSTGKMGYALAAAAQKRGAQVVLVTAPTALTPPAQVEVVPVTSAREMYEAVLAHFPTCAAVIKTAAVADYRPKQQAKHKLKKGEMPLVIELERNPDILYELGKRKAEQILIGFAAETQNIDVNAPKKIRDKNLDFIVANDVSQEGAGFGTDTNIVQFIFPSGEVQKLPQLPKEAVADRILDALVKLPKWK